MSTLGETLVTLRVDMGEVSKELRRLEEEMQLLAYGSDPWMPSDDHWRMYPWARYHTVDENGKGVFWRNGGIVLGADGWYQDEDTLQQYEENTHRYDADHIGPWEESLRVRPARIL